MADKAIEKSFHDEPEPKAISVRLTLETCGLYPEIEQVRSHCINDQKHV
jgi:hypothetical protein